MKKTTLAVAALLTTLSAATIAPAVYAADTSMPAPTVDTCKDGKDASGKDCVATDSTATPAVPATDGSATAPTTESTGSDS